jgi:hypothetical protein
MLNKLERYVSKNTPQNALQLIMVKSNLTPKTYQHRPLTDSTLYQWYGFIQRKNVEPYRLLPSINKSRIGFHQRAQTYQSMGAHTSKSFTEQSMIRKARIFFGETNHMQSTPKNKRKTWNIQIESTGWVRSHGMLWGRCGDDPYHKWGDRDEMRFGTVESCEKLVKGLGFEYEVIYPHERYHQTKAYADNFIYNRESVSDAEDNDEIFSAAEKI